MAKTKKAPTPRQEALKPYEYFINEKKKAVVYSIPAHGLMFIGTSKCGENDEFDVERGKKIAYLRALINMRTFDRDNTNDFIKVLKNESAKLRLIRQHPVSTHFMHAIQRATAERKLQEKHIAELRKELQEVTGNYDK